MAQPDNGTPSVIAGLTVGRGIVDAELADACDVILAALHHWDAVDEENEHDIAIPAVV